MNLTLQLIIGSACGFVLGFIAIAANISAKEKVLLSSWNNLLDALEMRYLKLKNILQFLHKYMSEFQNDIVELINLCDSAEKLDSDISSVTKHLELENSINYRLENIKSHMSNYPPLHDDPEVANAIIAIAESESNVGEAVRIYNSLNLEYKVFLETFPISIAAWILNKNADIPQFIVSMAEEFADNYIDEDEV